MLKKKICIVTQSHLSHNPRVYKEAKALWSSGYDVTIINSTYDRRLLDMDMDLVKDTGIKIISIASLEKSSTSSFIFRIIRKLGVFFVSKLNIQTPLAIGYGHWKYKSAALKEDACLYIGHQEIGLFCGLQLIKSGRAVAFDFEDWYSEDLLAEARKYRPIHLLQKLEEQGLTMGLFSITTSKSMAVSLGKRYKAEKLPTPIYNTFDYEENLFKQKKTFEKPIKLFWFSQTIGPGRGLESFIKLMNRINIRLEIHLLGNINDNYRDFLTKLVNPTYQIVFHPLVHYNELQEKISEFDIGLALELTEPLSRDLTVTNKFFQYVLSGLPVIATNTSGQKELLRENSFGFLIEEIESASTAKALENWLKDIDSLQTARSNAMKFAQKYSWQKESLKLIQLIKSNEPL